MKNLNTLENSIFYKTNLKIQNNLWKAYTVTLVVSFILVIVKGF